MEPRHAIILAGLFVLWTLALIWYNHHKMRKLRIEREEFLKFMLDKSNELQDSMNELRTQGSLVNDMQRETSKALSGAASLLVDVVMSVKHIANLSNGSENKAKIDEHIAILLDAIEKISFSAAEQQLLKLGEYHDEQERIEARRNDTVRSRIKRGAGKRSHYRNETKDKE